MNDKQIAEQLHLSVFTVRAHIAAARAALRAVNRIDLVVRARLHR